MVAGSASVAVAESWMPVVPYVNVNESAWDPVIVNNWGVTVVDGWNVVSTKGLTPIPPAPDGSVTVRTLPDMSAKSRYCAAIDRLSGTFNVKELL